MRPLRLMCIFAHPDDESLGAGGLLAKYAAEGVETCVVCATAGQQGWPANRPGYPGPEAFGKLRTAELEAACAVLDVRQVISLGYQDGALDQVDGVEVIGRLVSHLRQFRPQVVVTFGPDGAYGHPDHIAISQLALAATLCAADSDYVDAQALAPHRVAKCYYLVDSKAMVDKIKQLFGGAITIDVDGVTRRQVGWEEWAITTGTDASAHWEQVWQAIQCHATQLEDMRAVLEALPAEEHQQLWGRQNLYRAYSLVNAGRQVEDDLFAGIRISSIQPYEEQP